MTERRSSLRLSVLICGESEFTSQLRRGLRQGKLKIKLLHCRPQEAWQKILEEKPDFVVCGFNHGMRFQQLALYRRLFGDIRERFGNRIQIVSALLASSTLFFGGDLLFSEDSLAESGLIDAFIASTPVYNRGHRSLSDQLLQILELESERRIREPDPEVRLPSLNTGGWVPSLADPRSRELWYRWLPRYASYTNENPLIIGATGTGKTNLARSLHRMSGRTGDFVSITPRDFSSSELIQAELFGAVSGAYTGAVDKWGLVKAAEGGTLFIDELQSIDKELQGKLITFIENKSYRRVGSSESIDADVRFIFASNRKLEHMMDDSTLRDDFAYRLGRVVLPLPQLSERPLDIIPAIAFSLAKVFRQRPISSPVCGLDPEALAILLSCEWAGNLRQLENCIAQLCEVADIQKSSIIRREHVLEILESKIYGERKNVEDLFIRVLDELRSSFEKIPPRTLTQGEERFRNLSIHSALQVSGGDRTNAAMVLGETEEFLRVLGPRNS